MATKVDRTASMMCRAHGCSLEATMDRLLDAEKRIAELEAALVESNKLTLTPQQQGEIAARALYPLRAVTKGDEAK
jgi:hypothetical protein